MSIVASDLVAYAAVNMPEDESSSVGGAIDATRRVVFTDVASADTLEVLSSSGADTTQTLTVVGRAANGSQVTQTVTLNGTTVVPLTSLGTLERVQKANLSASCAGTVTVRRSSVGPTVATIPPGEIGFLRMFISAFSDVSPKNYYEKFFWKNTNGSLALLAATVQQSADPTGLITHCLANVVNDTATSTNRLTAPSGGNLTGGTFDDTDKACPPASPTGDLAAGAAIGVWLKFALGASQAPIKSTYTSQIAGQSV